MNVTSGGCGALISFERLDARVLLSGSGPAESSAIQLLDGSTIADRYVVDATTPASQTSPALDSVIFGSAGSESAHSLSSTSTQIIGGALSQTARQALPLNPVAVNGGSLTLTMAVDPVKRNYFSVKLWGGDDTDQGKGRLYLYINVDGTNFQVGYRHEGDYSPLCVTAGKPPCPEGSSTRQRSCHSPGQRERSASRR